MQQAWLRLCRASRSSVPRGVLRPGEERVWLAPKELPCPPASAAAAAAAAAVPLATQADALKLAVEAAAGRSLVSLVEVMGYNRTESTVSGGVVGIGCEVLVSAELQSLWEFDSS